MELTNTTHYTNSNLKYFDRFPHNKLFLQIAGVECQQKEEDKYN